MMTESLAVQVQADFGKFGAPQQCIIHYKAGRDRT